jgi:glycosyltransferase involved in cell wall biosynthesis
VDISVIICSHNPRADYLRRVLEALRFQTLPLDQWELLLVDNASRELLELHWDISWHPHGRQIREDELGLAAARQRGMREATADLLVFVDDDNVLDPDYLSKVVEIGGEWPRLGVWGSGATSPEFEVNPPEYLKEFLHVLALRDTRVPCWSNVFSCSEASPNGAGFCVRASVAAAYCQFVRKSHIHISGRAGSSLLSGEDVEICWLACELGFGIGVFPGLKLLHLIPKERITEGYLVRIFEGSEISQCLLKYKWRGIVPKDPLSPLSLLSILRNCVVLPGVLRRIYLAKVRGTLKIRRMIKAGQLGAPRQ